MRLGPPRGRDCQFYCGSRLRSGEVFAYVGLSQNLKDLKAEGLRSGARDTHGHRMRVRLDRENSGSAARAAYISPQPAIGTFLDLNYFFRAAGQNDPFWLGT